MNSFRKYIGIFSLLVIIFLILSGCAGWGRRMETPRITLANFNVQEIKLFESVFNIEIRVFNTNDIPLVIKGFDCDLEFNGKRLATGVSSAQINLPPYETVLVPMTLYSSVLGVVSVLRSLSKNEKLKYKLTGHLRLGKGTFPSLLPFESQGELPLEGLVAPNTG
ncbi:MAG: LEA type 2 family protein [Desulfobacterales bacterium]